MAVQTILPAQPAPANLQVFLLIGQSNMVGRGIVEAQDREPIARVWAQNKNLQWQPAVDPLHWDNVNGGVGVGRSFARLLAHANSNVHIGLVPAAVGGTSIQQWAPGGALYTEALRRVRAALATGTLRGILWHQGEADSKVEETARGHLQRLGAFFDTLRADLGAPDVPVVVGEIGEFLYTRGAGGYPFALAINEQLALTPVAIFRTAFVSSAGFGHIGDELHFNAEAQREFGRRYGLAFLSLDPAWSTLPK
jgi:hypothetical protein